MIDYNTSNVVSIAYSMVYARRGPVIGTAYFKTRNLYDR